jgi:sugar lactone lactonase YvrE
MYLGHRGLAKVRGSGDERSPRTSLAPASDALQGERDLLAIFDEAVTPQEEDTMRRTATAFALLSTLVLASGSSAHAGVLYAVGDPGIMKVDTNTGAVLGVLAAQPPTGEFFGHILLDRQGDLLAEIGPDDAGSTAASGQVARISPLTGDVVGTFVAAGSGGLANPDGMAFGPDGNLYVLDFAADSLWILRKYDGTSGAFLGVVANIATGFLTGPVFGPDGTIYLTDNSLGTIRKLDGATGAPIGFVVPAGAAPDAYGLTFGPDGNLWVSVSTPTPELRIYDPANGTVVRDVTPRDFPRSNNLQFAADGSLYITTPEVPPGGILKLAPGAGSVTQLVASSVTIVAEGLSLTCNPGVNQVCMLDGRFRAEVTWQTAAGEQGQGRPISYSDDTSEFWFFGPGNLEMVVKMIDGCALNQHYWMFAGGLTNVAVTLTVTDTQTGVVKTYKNAQNAAFKPIQDSQAFANCS